MKNQAIYSDKIFEKDIIISEEELYRIARLPYDDVLEFVRKVNKAVHDGIGHYYFEDPISVVVGIISVTKV